MEVTTGLVQPFGWGLGYPDWADPASPAAGSPFTWKVTGENIVRLVAARCVVSTDVNVANRFVSLDYQNARGVTYCRNAGSLVLTASTVNQAFEWNTARTLAEWNTNTPVLAPLMPAFLPPGFVVAITLDNIQAGDAITAVHLWVERYPTGPRGLPQGGVTQDEYERARFGLVPD